MGVGGQRHTLTTLTRERPGIHCITGWVDPRAALDWCGNSRPHRESIPGPSRVSIPTELSRTTLLLCILQKRNLYNKTFSQQVLSFRKPPSSVFIASNVARALQVGVSAILLWLNFYLFLCWNHSPERKVWGNSMETQRSFHLPLPHQYRLLAPGLNWSSLWVPGGQGIRRALSSSLFQVYLQTQRVTLQYNKVFQVCLQTQRVKLNNSNAFQKG